MSLGYNETDPGSIEDFGQRLIGKTVRDIVTKYTDNPASLDKGKLGNLIQEFHFGQKPNNDPRPDFAKAGVELKCTPVRTDKKGTYGAKERISLSMIDFPSIMEESWPDCAYLKKNRKLLIVVYAYDPDAIVLDYRIIGVRLWSFDDLPDHEQYRIREDWKKIATKVRTGLAHELSEGDTELLGAARKGGAGEKKRPQPASSILAYRRAYTLKQGYVKELLKRDFHLVSERAESAYHSMEDFSKAGGSIRTFTEGAFERFMGRADEQIARTVGYPRNRSKSYHAMLSRRMLGVPTWKIKEFEKADIIMKTVRLSPSGRPKEHVSFPAFVIKDLLKETWEESDFRAILERTFCFVVFRYDERGALRFEKTVFWTMPQDDIEGEAKRIWHEAREAFGKGVTEGLPGAKENRVGHVRPHGKEGKDIDVLPDGSTVTKQCFWLNQDYVADVLA